ncbi:hypothetical protein AGLY_016389 [Aphis glycines]|uniref:Uncharacterized protein n=1 Tax=Aphis glycines TaxID=307491 RepID=A0A6G0SY80_APHGL|nr:hypothetical protein AGLY_016389 [Aphis glycines]
MTLKMNSLITSIIVLTFFTTIIPILGNVDDSDNKAYLKLKDEDIPYETLITFRQKYETEILQFCQKNNIEITYEEAIMSASLLYFKESFEEFIMYVLLKDDTKDNEYKTNLEQFKNKFLEAKDIEEEYFSREFRFFCAMSVVDDFNLEDVKVNPLINYVSKKEYTQFVVHFIKELNELNSTLFPETEITIGDIKYNEESAERKIAVDKLIKIKTINFEKKWSFVDKQFDDLNVYYLIYDKIQSSGIIHKIDCISS